MRFHTLNSYRDGFKNIPYCVVCGVEYPDGECSGVYVEKKETEKGELTEKKKETR